MTAGVWSFQRRAAWETSYARRVTCWSSGAASITWRSRPAARPRCVSRPPPPRKQWFFYVKTMDCMIKTQHRRSASGCRKHTRNPHHNVIYRGDISRLLAISTGSNPHHNMIYRGSSEEIGCDFRKQLGSTKEQLDSSKAQTREEVRRVEAWRRFVFKLMNIVIKLMISGASPGRAVREAAR